MTWQIILLLYVVWCAGLYVHKPIEPTIAPDEPDDSPGRHFNILG